MLRMTVITLYIFSHLRQRSIGDGIVAVPQYQNSIFNHEERWVLTISMYFIYSIPNNIHLMNLPEHFKC